MRLATKAALLAAVALAPFAATAEQPGAGASAPAQDSGAAAPGDPESADIVVTARKRDERLQEVPLTITAFDTGKILSARIENLQDVAKLTPGLNYAPLFGRQNQLPIIRGAAQTFGELNVGVFLDGVYLSGKAGVDLQLNDLERIEVVKGPQSALYGRNTFAGAINYITKAPSSNFGGRLEATGGTNGLAQVIGNVNVPLADTLKIRVGGFYRHFDGFYRSGIDGGKVDFQDNYGFNANVLWEPINNFSARLRFVYERVDEGQPPSSVIRNNAFPGTPPGSAVGAFRPTRNLLYVGELPSIPLNGVTVNTQSLPGQPSRYGDREESIRGSLILRYEFPNAQLVSISAVDKRNVEYTFDGDNTVCQNAGGCQNFGFPFAAANPVGASAYALSSNRGFLRDVSQEIRLQSTGKRTFDWLVGFYYYNNINFGVDRGVSPLSNNLFNGYNTNYSFPQQRFSTDSYSAFGSITAHLNSKVAATAEIRYEREYKTFTQVPTFATTQITPADPLRPFTGTTRVFDLSQSFSFVTPRFILNYQATPDFLLYGIYGRGAKTGGFNGGLNIFDNQRSYNPEYTDNFEIGFKSDWFDRRLRFNVAGYYNNWSDQQAACQNPASAGGTSTNRTYVCNVAASQIHGFEVDSAFRFNRYLLIAANYAYTDARYTRFVDDSLAGTLALLGQPPISFYDKRLPYVPRHKVTISPVIEYPMGDVRLELRSDITYQDRSYLRADNLQYFGGRENVDLRLTGYYKAFRVQLFANNVTDNKTPFAGVRFFDSSNYSVASPLVQGPPRRQLGASVGVNF
ncbi:MAG: TonB-dependent receptor [Sphingomonadaceae bacterium]|nr:TonB-dependent receptor [Sphingomonadaceae bacterium]